MNSVSVAWGDGDWLARSAPVLAATTVAAWALLTRLLHWDGLADVADAYWGGATKERRLEIMADSSTGAFGASAIALVALTQVAAISILLANIGMGVAIVAVPVFGRLAASFGSWLGKPARPGGLGAQVMGRPRLSGLLIAALALTTVAVPMVRQHDLNGAIWLLVAFFTAAAVPHLLAKRFGGVTGDVLGASVLLTETLTLALAAMMVTF